MLWTLHNRAAEAMRPDGIIHDPKAVEIYRSIDYDYERNFGKAEPSHAVRSRAFDEELVRFVATHPDGTIINLGEGLETQRFRVETSTNLWISVDLIESIAIRQKFIQPDEFHRHLPFSALDQRWMELVPEDKPICITAQGLLMYFEENQVRDLMRRIGDRFPGAILLFDTIPRWFSRKTLRGMKKTKFYTAPRMPWGINRNEIRRTLLDWDSRIAWIDIDWYRFPRGFFRIALPVFQWFPWLKDMPPVLVRLQWR